MTDQNVNIVTPPAVEPLSPTELRNYCQIDFLDDTERALLALFGIAGRRQIEHATRLTMIATTYKLSIDRWPTGELRLPRRPATGISSVTYIDPTGTTQTLPTSAYQFVERELWSSVWVVGPLPAILDTANAVRITFTAGWSDAASVPAELRVALGSWARHNYDNRTPIVEGKAVATLPYAYEAILSSHSAPEA